MKQELKLHLLSCFPSVEQKYMERMKGKKSAANFVVLLTYGNELFARCFHRYYNGELVERQRYVFTAKNGCCRYSLNNDGVWSIRKEFKEPVFNKGGYAFDNSYTVLGLDNIKKSCMRYSQAESYSGSLFMQYLKLYCRYPNVEYLMKTGYSVLIYEQHGYWGVHEKISISSNVNLKSNNLLKMLGLNRTEFKVLQGNEKDYDSYVKWRNKCPNNKPEEILTIAKQFGDEYGTADNFCKSTFLTPLKIAKYLSKNNITNYEYRDYLQQCKTLEYKLTDSLINRPKNFYKMHERLSKMIQYQANKKMRESFEKLKDFRKLLEYESGEFMIIQPPTFDSIVAEGRELSHCVGGYAERHALGALNIMFLRKKDEPDKPFYTIEVSKNNKIVQCRGYKNNWVANGGAEKPQEILDLEKEYQNYLDSLKIKKERKTA